MSGGGQLAFVVEGASSGPQLDLLRTYVRRADPAHLAEIADSWVDVARALEDTARQLLRSAAQVSADLEGEAVAAAAARLTELAEQVERRAAGIRAGRRALRDAAVALAAARVAYQKAGGSIDADYSGPSDADATAMIARTGGSGSSTRTQDDVAATFARTQGEPAPQTDAQRENRAAAQNARVEAALTDTTAQMAQVEQGRHDVKVPQRTTPPVGEPPTPRPGHPDESPARHEPPSPPTTASHTPSTSPSAGPDFRGSAQGSVAPTATTAGAGLGASFPAAASTGSGTSAASAAALLGAARPGSTGLGLTGAGTAGAGAGAQLSRAGARPIGGTGAVGGGGARSGGAGGGAGGSGGARRGAGARGAGGARGQLGASGARAGGRRSEDEDDRSVWALEDGPEEWIDDGSTGPTVIG